MEGKTRKCRPKAGTSRLAVGHRRKLFVEAYITNGGNATAAAKTAGYSPKTARRQGSRLLTDVHISQAIAERQASLLERHEINTNNVIQSMARALFFDPRKLFDAEGRLKPPSELDDDTAAALVGLEVVALSSGPEGDTPMHVKKIKWESKATARDQALKYLGMYKKDNEQNRSESGIYSLSRAELEKIARGE